MIPTYCVLLLRNQQDYLIRAAAGRVLSKVVTKFAVLGAPLQLMLAMLSSTTCKKLLAYFERYLLLVLIDF